MARCDILGAQEQSAAPLAIITATIASAEGAASLNADSLKGVNETILSQAKRDGLTLIRVQGTPPNSALRNVYWRAAGEIGEQTLGLAIYESGQSESLGTRARALLTETFLRSFETPPLQTDKSATPT